MSIDAAMQTAVETARSEPGCRSEKPGLSMISIPTKPSPTAIQRRARTTSRKISALPKVAKSGAVKLNAVTSATGMRASALVHMRRPTNAIMPRVRCRPKRFVCRTANPDPNSHGTMKRNPNKLRKKAIWNGCRSAERLRMSALMVVSMRPADIIHRAPRIGELTTGKRSGC